jgi:hypothetical protein
LPPVGLANENDSVGAKTLRQKLDGSCDTPTYPGGTDTGCHTALFVGYVAGCVAMNEVDSIDAAY